MPHAGEIRLFGFNFAPLDWEPCQGTALPVDSYPALFARIGYSFGGAGPVFFTPDLRGRVMYGVNALNGLGAKRGQERVTLTPAQLPGHAEWNVRQGAADDDHGDGRWLGVARDDLYSTGPADALSSDGAMSQAGGDVSHENMPPFLGVNHAIFAQSDQDNGEPFIGELRAVAFNFAPKTYADCDGRLLPISQYTALYSLLGNSFGGNGITHFAVPDLRGRFPLGPGQGPGLSLRLIGQSGGAEEVTLTEAQMPRHNGRLGVSRDLANDNAPGGRTFAVSRTPAYARQAWGAVALGGVVSAGAGAAHNNMPPFLTTNYVIATSGLYPLRP